jgi:HK97 family phage major capsid protein
MNLTAVRAALALAIQNRQAAQAALVVCRENPASTAEEITAATAARDAFDPEITTLTERESTLVAEEAREAELTTLMNRVAPGSGAVAQARTSGTERAPGDGVVRREDRTYTADKDRTGSASFFADLYRSTKPGNRDFAAEERLRRHDTELRVEREASTMVERATTTTSYAGLIPPQYLVDQYALVARAGRPYANSVVNLELPNAGMSFVIPRGTTGATAAIQSTQNTSVSSTDEVWADLTVPVATIAGQQDVSRQSLERGTPGLDQIVFADIAGAYGVAVDVQTLSGTGASGQVLGTLATAGINQATAFTAAGTPATVYTKMAGQLSAIETTRFLAPDLIVMHPRRWNWFLGQVDAAGRPFVVPDTNGPFNALGVAREPVDTPSTRPVGQMLGLNVITDASIPTAVGTGPEDQILIVRRADMLLWEDGPGTPHQLTFEQTLGNQLTVKLVAYGYIAFTAGRYPTAVGVVGGNSASTFGLVAPTF